MGKYLGIHSYLRRARRAGVSLLLLRIKFILMKESQDSRSGHPSWRDALFGSFLGLACIIQVSANTPPVRAKSSCQIFFPCVWVIKTPGLPWSPSNWLPNTASESHIILHSACLKVSSRLKHCWAFQVCAVTPFITHERDSRRPKSQGTLSSLLYSVCLFILPQHKQ